MSEETDPWNCDETQVVIAHPLDSHGLRPFGRVALLRFRLHEAAQISPGQYLQVGLDLEHGRQLAAALKAWLADAEIRPKGTLPASPTPPELGPPKKPKGTLGEIGVMALVVMIVIVILGFAISQDETDRQEKISTVLPAATFPAAPQAAERAPSDWLTRMSSVLESFAYDSEAALQCQRLPARISDRTLYGILDQVEKSATGDTDQLFVSLRFMNGRAHAKVDLEYDRIAICHDLTMDRVLSAMRHAETPIPNWPERQ